MKKEYILDRPGIDAIAEEVQKWLKRAGVSKNSGVRIRLTMEELLLRIYGHYEGGIKGTLLIKRGVGASRLIFSYEGEEYNPISQSEEQDDTFFPGMMARLGLQPEWTYKRGTNKLLFRVPGRTVRMEVKLVAAVLLAVLSGILAPAIPGGLRSGLLEYLYDPVSETFMDALNTFIGFMILFTILGGICSIGSVADFSRMGKRIIFRMIGLTFAEIALCFVLMLPFFNIGAGGAAGGHLDAGEIVDLLFSIVPSNPVSPFIDNNMLQIVFIALMTGSGILVLGEKAERIRGLVHEFIDLFMEMISVVCRLLPLYIYSTLTIFLWKNGAGVFIQLWKPILVTFLANFLVFVIKVIWVRLGMRVPVTTFIRKIIKNMSVGFMTASSSAVFNQMLTVNENDLGIAPDFNQFASPFALFFVDSPGGISYTVILFYLAELYHTPANLTWKIILLIMACVFSVTSPPVSGGMLVCIGMLMTQLNIPMEGIAIAGILGIVTDFIATGFKIGISHLELLLEADAFKKADRQTILEK